MCYKFFEVKISPLTVEVGCNAIDGIIGLTSNCTSGVAPESVSGIRGGTRIGLLDDRSSFLDTVILI